MDAQIMQKAIIVIFSRSNTQLLDWLEVILGMKKDSIDFGRA